MDSMLQSMLQFLLRYTPAVNFFEFLLIGLLNRGVLPCQLQSSNPLTHQLVRVCEGKKYCLKTLLICYMLSCDVVNLICKYVTYEK